MDPEIIEWIETAAKKLMIRACPLPANESNAIVSQAKAAFVVGSPRAWWMSPKTHPQVYDPKTHRLEDVLPSKHPSYWFIPETEQPVPPVFDLKLSDIQAIIGGCPFFEYYIVDKEYRWLVAESDHNQYHVVLAT